VIQGPFEGVTGTIRSTDEINGSCLVAFNDLGSGVFARIPYGLLTSADDF
jgi:hypothetical protein